MRLFTFIVSVALGNQLLHAQNAGFEIKDQASGELISGSATFYQPTTAYGLYNRNFTIENKGSTPLTFYLIKTEAIRNIPAKGDSAEARFCTSIRCYPSAILNETITVKPGEVMVLGCEFDEASWPGYSLIEYKLKNKETGHSVFLIMKYTGAVSLNEGFKFDNSIRSFPNPASSILHLELVSRSEGTNHLLIVNSAGQKVLDLTLQLHPGTNSIELPCSDWPEGIYFLRVQEDLKAFSQMFTIVH